MSNGDSNLRGTGWITFAGIVLIIVGVVSIFDGIWAFRYSNQVEDLPDDSLAKLVFFEDNLTAWGWIWLILGIVILVAGIGVFSRQQWARWTGIVVASLAILGNLSWAAIQGSQALIGTLMAILVIYGLAAHGGELEE